MSLAARTLAPASSLARRLNRDRAGNISMIFGMSVVAMFSAAGGAIDFARWFSAKSKLQVAMDSASLAGARALQVSPSADTSVGIAMANTYFTRLKPPNLDGIAPSFTVAESGTVLHGEVAFSVPTPFLSVIGIPNFAGRVVAEAVIAAGGNAGSNLELSLMLDTTGSMLGQKIEDLKVAAKELIETVVWADQGQYTAKVALAPFAARVNVGPYIAQVTGMSQTWSGKSLRPCVTERTGGQAFTDAAPGSGAWLNGYGADRASDSQNYNLGGTCTSPQEQVMPLTSDKQALKDRIDSFTAGGSTAGSLGTAWAWYMISPNWSSIWPSASTPAPYSDLTTLSPRGVPRLQKVVVLMTDGIYNTTGGVSFGDTSTQAQTISANAIAICNNMKAAGIKVYTVGFHLGSDQLAIDTLKACASREVSDPADMPSYFIAAESGDELRGAFRQIALQLSTLRIRM
ncbi:MAG: pilus assembly protein [Hyphomicrobiaceae bacterium]